jgi:aldehyde dehydrogenase (NAD+)
LELRLFDIDGEWRAPSRRDVIQVMNPSTDGVYSVISAGTADDVDLAVAAAKAVYPSWSSLPLVERVAFVSAIARIYVERIG